MYCTNCGTKNENNAKFCQNCGGGLSHSSSGIGTADVRASQENLVVENKIMAEVQFYSQSWLRTKIFALSNLPQFDILITDKSLYVIELPSSSLSQFGMFGLIGALLANSLDQRKRSKFRSAWLDSNNNFISEEYEKSTILKIPKEKLKGALELKKTFRQRLAIFNYNGENITLRTNKAEYERFIKYIETYVL